MQLLYSPVEHRPAARLSIGIAVVTATSVPPRINDRVFMIAPCVSLILRVERRLRNQSAPGDRPITAADRGSPSLRRPQQHSPSTEFAIDRRLRCSNDLDYDVRRRPTTGELASYGTTLSRGDAAVRKDCICRNSIVFDVVGEP